MDFVEFLSKPHSLFLDEEGNLHYNLVLGHCEEFSGRRGLKKFHCFKDETEMLNFEIEGITFYNNKGQTSHPEIGTNVAYDNDSEQVFTIFIAIILNGEMFPEDSYLIQCRKDLTEIVYKYDLYHAFK